eukprot:1189044-Prorocentrum_minimum.AAC.2
MQSNDLCANNRSSLHAAGHSFQSLIHPPGPRIRAAGGGMSLTASSKVGNPPTSFSFISKVGPPP